MPDENPTTKCCGFPGGGACPDCPDPEMIEWGKRNPPKWIKTISQGIGITLIILNITAAIWWALS